MTEEEVNDWVDSFYLVDKETVHTLVLLLYAQGYSAAVMEQL